jgi:uncharacterized iron-regulated membrane protein
MEGNWVAVNSHTAASQLDAEISAKRQTSRLGKQRAFWLFCHRWMGVILGLPVALIGFTGSLILLVPMLLGLQHGDLLQPQSAIGTYTQPSAWVASARAANSPKLEIIAVSAPNQSPLAAETALVIGHTHEGAEGDYHRVFSVDPYTAKLQGHYDFETSYAFIATAVHTSLLIPVIGLNIVAILGVLLSVSIVTGVYLWWPRGNGWGAAFKFKTKSRGLARWYSLHNVLGIYCAFGLLILSVTGVWLLRPDWVEPAVTIASPIREAPLSTALANGHSCAVRTTPEQAISVATAALPDRKLAFLLSPEEDRKFFEVNLTSANDWNARDGDTTVFINPICAQVAKIIDGKTLSGAEVAKRSTVPLHNGRVFGTVGEILVFVIGLSLPIFYVSGLVLWWKRRKFGKAKP